MNPVNQKISARNPSPVGSLRSTDAGDTQPSIARDQRPLTGSAGEIGQKLVGALREYERINPSAFNEKPSFRSLLRGPSGSEEKINLAKEWINTDKYQDDVLLDSFQGKAAAVEVLKLWEAFDDANKGTGNSGPSPSSNFPSNHARVPASDGDGANNVSRRAVAPTDTSLSSIGGTEAPAPKYGSYKIKPATSVEYESVKKKSPGLLVDLKNQISNGCVSKRELVGHLMEKQNSFMNELYSDGGGTWDALFELSPVGRALSGYYHNVENIAGEVRVYTKTDKREHRIFLEEVVKDALELHRK